VNITLPKLIFTKERCLGLAERRQRKRVKRDIIKSPPNPDKENNDAGPKKANRKTGKGAKTEKRIQAGFALMHGLSATNVGRNRLTVCLNFLLIFER
jgi:hypothetical protein